jgi:polysaccharide pyruvyl transferase WcaK-like protein
MASLVAALDALAERTGLPLHLVAMDTERDVAFNDELATLVRAPVTVAAPTLDTVLGEVARSRLVVAMRFHAVVAALLGARPVVAIGYAPKVASLAAEMGGWAELVEDTVNGHAQVASAGATLLGRADNPDVTGDLRSLHQQLAGGPRGLCAHERALDQLLGDA